MEDKKGVSIWPWTRVHVVRSQGILVVPLRLGCVEFSGHRPAARRLQAKLPRGPRLRRAGKPQCSRVLGPICYVKRLMEVDVQSSVGCVDDSYDNALSEPLNGLCPAEVLRQRVPWKAVEDSLLRTLNGINWFNRQQQHEPGDYISPTECEMNDYNHQVQSSGSICRRGNAYIIVFREPLSCSEWRIKCD